MINAELKTDKDDSGVKGKIESSIFDFKPFNLLKEYMVVNIYWFKARFILLLSVMITL